MHIKFAVLRTDLLYLGVVLFIKTVYYYFDLMKI